ncbi:glycosyltransferase [Rhizobium johnstonii]
MRYYIDHPDEAYAIAKAGQAMTLRDHTYKSGIVGIEYGNPNNAKS